MRDGGGNRTPVIRGCYGIGPSRVMGTIVEALADEKGIVWPEAVAPFRVHLVSLGQPGDVVSAYADALYGDMTKRGVSVLYDDRNLRAGEKFADADLIGIPRRVIIGKEAAESGAIEVVERASGTVQKRSRDEVLTLSVDGAGL